MAVISFIVYTPDKLLKPSLTFVGKQRTLPFFSYKLVHLLFVIVEHLENSPTFVGKDIN